MRLICSYCRQSLPDKEPLDDPRVSHGMCSECAAHFKRQWSGLDLRGYLEGLSVPVVVVDPDGRIVAANSPMAAMLGWTPETVVGMLGGEVFDCVYARLPEGCGKTEHCVACTVRRTVMQTMATGEPLCDVPAYVRRRSGRLDLQLSTERIPAGVRVVVGPRSS